MSQDLIVIGFDQETRAQEALRAIRAQQKQGQIDLKDTAIVSKDQEGKVHRVNEVSSATEIGAVAGGGLGLMLTVLFPVAGIAVGAATGAAIGALLGQGVDRGFVKEVTENLKPGTSALFLVFGRVSPEAIRALEPYSGHLVQTTLPEDLEARLRESLHEEPPTRSPSQIFG
jgi:uncharacterized membrane protein